MGRTSRSSPPNHHYAQLSRDLERVVQEVKAQLGAKKTAGIFHSMSARTAMKHAIEIGWRWDALMLFDPPDVPPKGHPLYAAMEVFENKLTEWAKGRRRRFARSMSSTEEYKQSRATARWVAGEHELMARSVLRQSPDGDGYELTCAPENEAAIYAQALTLDLWPKAVASSAGRSSWSAAIRISRARPRPGRPTRRSASKAATTTASSRAPAICCRSRSRTSASG